VAETVETVQPFGKNLKSAICQFSTKPTIPTIPTILTLSRGMVTLTAETV